MVAPLTATLILSFELDDTDAACRSVQAEKDREGRRVRAVHGGDRGNPSERVARQRRGKRAEGLVSRPFLFTKPASR